MCIIAVYEKGLVLNENELKTCFQNNPDGAGLMYQKNGKVRIEKGFMTWEGFWHTAKQLPVDVDRVFHFRIATSGKISTACCHPFPVCDDYKKMSLANCTVNMGFAHNGVLNDFEPPKGMKSTYSDSMKFGKEVLYPLGKLLNERSVRDFIELYTTSRFAIMTPKKTYMVGIWEQSRESGAFYSNDTFDCHEYCSIVPTKEDYSEGIFVEKVPADDEAETTLISLLEGRLAIFIYDTSYTDEKDGCRDTVFFFDRGYKEIPLYGTVRMGNKKIKWRYINTME